MLNQVLNRLHEQRQPAIDRLCDWLRIPSVSTDPAFAPDVRRAAQWAADRLRECGLDVKIVPTKGHPVVMAKTKGRRDEGTKGRSEGNGSASPPSSLRPSVPTSLSSPPSLLFYGHYDVQPPDPIDLWTTPPFQPTIRDGAIYARGADDDKGQVSTFLEALRAWHDVAGQIPINLTVILEGEEECGSANLVPFLEAHKAELAADVAIVSDTAMWGDADPILPAITYGLRGLVYFDIQLHGPARDLHSGVYGGTVPNPATELAIVLGQLFDSNHRINIPGFYDDVAPITADERAQWDALHFDERKMAQSVGLEQLHGEAGFSTLERRWARPCCDINGLYGGYMGQGAKTVIPSFAGAKVSFRIPPDMNPLRVDMLFRDFLTDHTPPGCSWKIEQHGAAHPVLVPTDSPYLQAAKRAITIATGGTAPVLMREGATIPVISDFKRILGINTVMMGFGRHDDAIHSPNEHFRLDCFDLGRRAHAAMIDELRKM
ncbi:MAG: M20/M25/M40 family metallo-hydrolase [Phycisphaeraceae bacterium]